MLILLIPVLSTGSGASQTLVSNNSSALGDHVEYRTFRFEIDGDAVLLHMVLVDSNAIMEGEIILDAAPGGEFTGSIGSVPSIGRRESAIACINGPYFATTGSRVYPLGFAIHEGRPSQLGNLNRPVVGVTSEGRLVIENTHPRVFITSDQYFEPLWLWGINTRAGNDAVTMYDKNWGTGVEVNEGTAVIVRPVDPGEEIENLIELGADTFDPSDWDGICSEIIEEGIAEIPEEGFVLVFKGRQVSSIDRFTSGSHVTAWCYDLSEEFRTVRWAATLGPWFINNGHSRNYRSETPYGGNITSSAERSVIGSTWNNEIFFAVTTGKGLTVTQTADLLLDCNVKEAVMCDSGSSSSMWIEGVGKLGSSREVPMAFVIKEAGEEIPEEWELRIWEGTLPRY